MGFTFLKMMFLIASVCTSSLCLAAPETYDAMVVGAGPAGVAAALQSGRAGASTLLVERGVQVGGNMTTGGVNFPGLTVAVTEAKGEKCPRCWIHSENADENGLCKRCAAVIAKLDVEF
jgi:ribulose 1,5-bisphosphate synthetase/thiazole synthase